MNEIEELKKEVQELKEKINILFEAYKTDKEAIDDYVKIITND
jgi:flagellum-specific peptidoglycan hydrolase FlgJ